MSWPCRHQIFGIILHRKREIISWTTIDIHIDLYEDDDEQSTSDDKQQIRRKICLYTHRETERERKDILHFPIQSNNDRVSRPICLLFNISLSYHHPSNRDKPMETNICQSLVLKSSVLSFKEKYALNCTDYADLL